jgi:APA family basic amino acid/polyamine antiporter
MVIAGVLTTILVAVNYTRGLVELFTFFILLSTLTTLIPYTFSSLAVFLVRRENRRAPLSRGMAIVAGLALTYWLLGIW